MKHQRLIEGFPTVETVATRSVNRGGPSTHDDLEEIRGRLLDDTLAVAESLLGKPTARTRREARWGTRGSLALALCGAKAGLWFDHEKCNGGDIFALVTRETGGDFPRALQWARNHLGMAGPLTPDGSVERDRRRRNREARKEAQAEERRRDAIRIGEARRLWAESRPITGTLAEKYLNGRAIVSAEWPASIGWNPRVQAILGAVTDGSGEVVAVQMVAVTAEGYKDEERIWDSRAPDHKRAKQSKGPVSAGAVKLPGSPLYPLCFAEGLETGLSIWAATGFETWVTLGSLKRAPDIAPTDRRLILCRDDDPPANPSHKAANAALESLRFNGCDAREAFPWDQRRQNKQDFNDLAQESGLAAVKERVNAAARDLPKVIQLYLEADEARELLNQRVGEFFQAARDWKGSTPPVHAIGFEVGGGKSQKALERSHKRLTDLRAAGDGSVIVAAVPTHKLSDELAVRFNDIARSNGSALRAEVWRGREAERPDGQGKMCAAHETVREAQKLVVNIEKEVCAVCPHASSCPYLAQREKDADAWVVAHQMIFSPPPESIRQRGVHALIVDESPYAAGLFWLAGLPIEAMKNEGAMPLLPGIDGDLLRLRRTALAEALSVAPDGYLSKAALAGFTSEICKQARKLEWDRKVEGGDWRQREENKTLLQMVGLWNCVASLAEPDGPAVSGRLSIDTGKDGVRRVHVCGRKDISGAWRVPTVAIDATLDVELIRPYWPQIEHKGSFRIRAPHQRVRQASRKTYSKNALDPSRGDTPARQNSRRRIRDSILARSATLGGETLVVGNKAVVEAIDWPEGFHAAWFNAVAGRDAWGHVRSLAVIGRSMPKPKDVEQLAGALTGKAPLSLGGEPYPKRAANRQVWRNGEIELLPTEAEFHPDPIAERIRERIVCGELVQAIGRGRGVNRTVDQPLEVTVYGSTPIPFPLDEIVTADDVEPGPVERQLAAGGIAFTGGAAAFRAHPGLWPTQRAATVAIQREHKCTNSNKNFLLENVHHCPELVPVSFQKAGERQRPQSAIIDTRRHPDPRAAIEAVLGPLAKFEMKPRLVASAQREQAAAPTDAPLTEEAEMENRSIKALLDTMAAEA